MKRYLLTISLVIAGGVALAQEYPQQLIISRSIAGSNITEQKAVETIIASNAVSQGASVIYTAGKSITLQAGFVAHAGSVFEATIAPVSSRLSRSDVPGLTAQAYPNPFLDQTTIEYNLPVGTQVRHTLLDSKGQVLRQINDGVEQSAGYHQTKLEGSDLPTGVYIYQIHVGNESRTLRLLKK